MPLSKMKKQVALRQETAKRGEKSFIARQFKLRIKVKIPITRLITSTLSPSLNQMQCFTAFEFIFTVIENIDYFERAQNVN